MELIIISESKLKVMLTPTDMAGYSGDTKNILRHIMMDAEKKCGFSTLNNRIFVQMYPSKEGGCELFVTKYQKQEQGILQTNQQEYESAEYHRIIYRQRMVVYRFEEIDYLLSCCSSLEKMHYHGSSRAYHDPERKQYYLRLDCETPAAGENFGFLCPSQTFYYINEHCHVLCPECAVETLSSLA